MNGASKILTVSYGTFSCTLEGFDDPFNTMKAIAEYFRDLAAEDRYFGAEPPTPDAAMLHRIAEREIQRRVEAKINENGVVLRAGELTARPAPAPAPAPVLTEAAPAESVAARLSRLRAEAAPAPAAYDAFIEDEHAEATVAEPPRAAMPVLPALAVEEEPVIEAAAPAPAEVVEAPEADDDLLQRLTLDPLSAPEISAPAAPVEIGVEDMAADDLGISLADVIATEVPAEPAPAEAAAPEAEPAVIEAAFDVPESLVPAAEEDHAEEDHEAISLDLPDLSGILPETEIEPQTATEAQAAIEPEDLDFSAFEDLLPESTQDSAAGDVADILPELAAEADGDAASESDDDMLARLVGGDADAEPASQSEPEPEPVGQADAVAGPVMEAVELDSAPETAPAVAEAAPLPMSDKIQRARARVIHVRRSPSLAVARPAAPEAPLTQAAQAEAPVQSGLSDEAEEALKRELAALEAESRPAEQPVAAAEALDAVEDATEPRPRLEPEADAAVERLIAQTNTAMEGPENKRRLSAIAHLKAAVAATLAERLSRGPAAEKSPSREEAYRDDLERAVRPRPTLAEAPRAEGVAPAPRPAATERPSPLVLVSEQRIDRPRPAAAPIVPVRPRRVVQTAPAPQPAATLHPAAAAQQTAVEDEDDDLTDEDAEAIFADSHGFAEFAEKLGATDLAGMLEAAAAYAACVEGRPHFSRPQLIRQVAAVAEIEISREDSLRSFGRLLRDGRIVKLRRGQFALTDRSHLLAEAKKIAG
ncbi:MAG: hypothetical protein QM656_06775 [Paracoccaceae bacterium]